MQLLTGLITITLYAASFIFLLRHIIKSAQQSPSQPVPKVFFLLFFAAILSHACTVNFILFQNQQLHIDFYKASSLIFLVISALSLLALLRRMAVDNLVVFLLPWAAISVAVSLFIHSPVTKTIHDPGVISHVVISVLAYSILTLAAVQALLLASQEYFLKHHAFKGLFQYLPPLQTMDKLLLEMIILGFIFLSLSIASGFIFLDDMFAQHLIHKTILTIFAWSIFALLLGGHFAFGWRGITAAKLTLFGFLTLMLGYFGSKFALEIILKRI